MRRDLLGGRHGGLDGRVTRLAHAAHEADALGFVCTKVARGERQFARKRVVADDLGEALQRANIGREANGRLTNREAHVARRVAHVDRAENIDAKADSEAVRNANDWSFARLDGRDGLLETVDKIAQEKGAARGVSTVRENVR